MHVRLPFIFEPSLLRYRNCQLGGNQKLIVAKEKLRGKNREGLAFWSSNFNCEDGAGPPQVSDSLILKERRRGCQPWHGASRVTQYAKLYPLASSDDPAGESLEYVLCIINAPLTSTLFVWENERNLGAKDGLNGTKYHCC